MKKEALKPLLILTLIFISLISLFVQNNGEPNSEKDGPNPLKNIYFGEEHIHTSALPDAFAICNPSGWEDTYNYAMGKEIKLSPIGKLIKRRTPLDFIGITYHAEYLDVLPMLVDPNSIFAGTPVSELIIDDPVKAVNMVIATLISGVPNKEIIDPKSTTYKTFYSLAA